MQGNTSCNRFNVLFYYLFLCIYFNNRSHFSHPLSKARMSIIMLLDKILANNNRSLSVKNQHCSSLTYNLRRRILRVSPCENQGQPKPKSKIKGCCESGRVLFTGSDCWTPLGATNINTDSITHCKYYLFTYCT